MPLIDINGISIGYDDFPGRPRRDRALLLIHGHPLDRTMWRPQAEAVAAATGWRVLAPDLRGYGETTVVPGKTILATFAQDLCAFVERLGVGSIVVGGLSMGGQIAMEYARLQPDRLRGIVLAATFPRIDAIETQRYRRELADRIEREGMSAVADELLPRMLAAASIREQPALATHVHAMMRLAPPAGAAAALRGRAERPPYESVLALLNIPALIIVGDRDEFTTRADAEQMHALLSQSQLLWLPGVGHMPNLERPEAFNDALMSFLSGISA